MRRKCKLLPAMACIFMLGLTGCGHEHTWVDATCLTPRTCSECGETEGEAAGHKWVDATCENARFCEVCGETEGEPLGHQWTEATYTSPKTCSVCGVTEGEPLQAPYCIQNNIPFESMADRDLPYVNYFLVDGEPSEKKGMWFDKGIAHYTFGEITSEPAEQEGFVKITIPFKINMPATMYVNSELSDGAASSGFTYPLFKVADYYTGILVPPESLHSSDEMESFKEYEWNSTTYSIEYSQKVELSQSSWSGWTFDHVTTWRNETSRHAEAVLTIVIPEDYDGVVLAIENNEAIEPLKEDADEKDTTEVEDTYILDVYPVETHIFYRLSDIIQQ